VSPKLRALCWLLALLVCARPATADDITPADRVVDHINVREGPSTETPVIGELEKGDRAPLLLSVPRWYQIRLPDGSEGFVSKSWSKRLAAVVTPAAAGEVGFTIHFLDVGTGDSAIIDIGQQEIIIDGGNSTKVRLEYIQNRQIVDGPIELVVVAHGDSDHWKSLNRLMGFDGHNASPPQVLGSGKRATTGTAMDPRLVPDSPTSPSSTAFVSCRASRSSAPWRTSTRRRRRVAPSSGSRCRQSPTPRFRCSTQTRLPPARMVSECSYLINNASIVLMREIPGAAFCSPAMRMGRSATSKALAHLDTLSFSC
jgi:hypothetical protein